MTRLVGFLAMSLAWGLTWLPVKVAAGFLPPLHIAAVRFLTAGLVFGVVCLVGRVALRCRRPVRLVLASLVLTTFSYSLVFWGVAHAPTGIAAVVNLSLIPVFSMAIGALYGEETVTPRRLLAIGLGIAGLALLFSQALRAGATGSGIAVGLGSVAAGTLLYAWGAVISRPLTREMPALAVAFWETLIGAIALVPLAIAVEGWDAGRLVAALAEPRVVGSLAFLVGGGSLVGFTVYLWLLREWGPFRAGLYAFVSPAVAVTVGVLVLGEAFGPAELAGMLVMLGATALVLPRPARPGLVNAS